MKEKLEELHSEEIEDVVIGTIITNGKCFYALDFLQEEDFIKGYNKALLKAVKLFKEEKGIPPLLSSAPILFKDFLIQKGLLLVCGDYSYLVDLMNCAVMEEVFPYYLQSLKEYTQKRVLFVLPQKIKNAIEETNFELKDVKELVKEEMEKVEKMTAEITDNSLKEEAEKLIDRLNNGDEEDEQVILTGIKELDNLLGGFKRGQYIVIGARPSTGKTALAMTLMLNIVSQIHYKESTNDKGELITKEEITSVGFLSLEMDRASIFKRFVCSLGCISSNYLFGGRKADEELTEREKLVAERMLEISKHLKVSCRQGLTISQVKVVARELVENDKIKILFIDYLSLIKADSDKREAWENMADISRELNSLSKEFNITVVVICQLNRDAEKNEPNMSNIRNSGAIEQDADVVMFLSDPTRTQSTKKGNYYSVAYQEENGNIITCEKAKPIKVDIAKNRNGEQGSCSLMFLGEFMKFVSQDNCRVEKEFVNGVEKR